MERWIGIALLVVALAVPAGAATIVEMRHLPARPYTVVQGDSLGSLAWRLLGHSRAEQSLQRQVLHAKTTFAPGATIRVRPIHMAVRVEEGDTWASIAAQYRGLTGPGAPAWLSAWNGSSPQDGLAVGMVVQVPPALGTELAAVPAGARATLTPVMLNVHGQQLKSLAERRSAYRPKVQDPVYAFTWMGQPDVDPQGGKPEVAARPAPKADAGGEVGVVAVNPSTVSPATRAETPAAERVKAIFAEYEGSGLVASPLVAAEALAGCHALAQTTPVESMPSCDEAVCLHPPHSMAVPCGHPFETVRYDLTAASSTPVVPLAPATPADPNEEHDAAPARKAPADAARPASIREKILGLGAPPLVPLNRPVTSDEEKHVIGAGRPLATSPRTIGHGSLDEALYGAPPVVSPAPHVSTPEYGQTGLYGKTTSPVIAEQLKAVRTRIKNLRGSLSQPVPVAPVAPAPAITKAQVIPPPAPPVTAPIVTIPAPIITSPAPIAPAPAKAALVAPVKIAAAQAPVKTARKPRSALGRFGFALKKLVGMDRPSGPASTERADVTHLIHHLPSARGVPAPGVLADMAPIRTVHNAAVRHDPPAKKADPEPDAGYNWTMPAQSRR